MLSRSPSRSLLGAALALASVSCTSTTTTTTTDTDSSIHSILVRPSEFIGDTPCSDAPGAMRSYVATLVDRTFSEICGDGVCEPQERRDDGTATCLRDCAPLGEDDMPLFSPSCGDGACDFEKDEKGNKTTTAETKESCPVDCGGTIPAPFTLSSSLPAPCSFGVRFNDIVSDHLYSAYIDGYEESADELCPLGCITSTGRIDYKAIRSGSRHMQLAVGHGLPVEPRWLGSCGTGDEERTKASVSGTSLLRECGALADLEPGSSATSVEVAPQDALGDLKCAVDVAPGELGVASFDIESEESLGDYKGIGCVPTPIVQTYSIGIVPGSAVSFFISARAVKGGDVVWGAECSAFAEEGLTVRAACAPLTDKGSIKVDIAAVLAARKIACEPGVTYDGLLAGSQLVKLTSVPCTEALSFGPLAPGFYAVSLLIHSPGASTSIDCTAQVTPGRAAAAACP